MALLNRLPRRSFVWLLAVSLIGLSAMLVLQYRFLRSLERTTAIAERDALKSFSGEAADRVESYYRENALRALTITPTMLEGQGREMAQHFARTSWPGVRFFFVRDFATGLTRYFDARGTLIQPDSSTESAVMLSSASFDVMSRTKTPLESPDLTADEHDKRNRIILRPITAADATAVAVAGVALDPQASAEFAIGPLLQAAARKRFPNHRDVLVLALRGGDQKSVYASGLLRRDHETLTAAIPFIFSDWRVAVQDVCATPEQLAACNFRINALWTGIAALILCGAIVLALRTAMREAHLSQMKGEFVSNVSHELRTPLASIRVFGEYMALGRVKDEEKVREYGAYIERESRRLTSLINNILDFSKIESAQKKYVFEPVAITSLVSETVADFAKPLAGSAASVSVETMGDVPMIKLDAPAFRQALINLLDNAIKYGGDEPKIEVSIGSRNGDVTVAVRDHGIGIAACEQKKIFDKFYRVGSGLVHDIKGSGLGLAIVSHIVKAHGGRIEVQSREGEGSTFTIVLPTQLRGQRARALRQIGAEA